MAGDDSDSDDAAKIRRYTDLFAKIIQIFPKDKATLLVPKSPPHCSPDLHIFIDLSNIYIGFCKALASYFDYYFGNDGGNAAADAQSSSEIYNLIASKASARHVHVLDLAALNCILQRGRSTAHRVIVGSVPQATSNPMHRVYNQMFDQARTLGYDVTVMSRVSRDSSTIVVPDASSSSSSSTYYKEHGVDELLSFSILQTISNSKSPLSSSSAPGTIVLVTGDGQPSAFTNGRSCVGFFNAVEKALAQHWNVELYSFGRSLSSNWCRLAQSCSPSHTNNNSATFRIVHLDEFVLDLAPSPLVSKLKAYISNTQNT